MGETAGQTAPGRPPPQQADERNGRGDRDWRDGRDRHGDRDRRDGRNHRDRDGLSSREALGIAGLAMAPWLIDRMVQNREPPPIGYAPRYLPPTYYGEYGYGYAPSYGYGYPPSYGYGYPPVYGESYGTTSETIIEERYRSGGSGKTQPERQVAAGGDQARTVAPPPVVRLSDWRYDEIYQSSWGAAQVMRGHVVDQSGQEVGRLRNVIVGSDDRAISVLVEILGQRDGSESIANIPWDQVSLQGRDVVQVPSLEQAAARFSLFGDRNNVLAGALAGISKDSSPAQRTWKTSDLINDYVTLSDGSGYGYVDDVVFDPSGRIQAVVVKRDVAAGGGTYAFPFYGAPHGFDPWLPYYALPYDGKEVAGLERFDEGRLD